MYISHLLVVSDKRINAVSVTSGLNVDVLILIKVLDSE